MNEQIKWTERTEHRSELWPEPSAHRLYWERNNCALVYEYDPTDDGPEVAVINLFKHAFPLTWDVSVVEAARDLSLGLADDFYTRVAAYYIEESLENK
jgi:hypothetical protein